MPEDHTQLRLRRGACVPTVFLLPREVFRRGTPYRRLTHLERWVQLANSTWDKSSTTGEEAQDLTNSPCRQHLYQLCSQQPVFHLA